MELFNRYYTAIGVHSRFKVTQLLFPYSVGLLLLNLYNKCSNITDKNKVLTIFLIHLPQKISRGVFNYIGH